VAQVIGPKFKAQYHTHTKKTAYHKLQFNSCALSLTLQMLDSFFPQCQPTSLSTNLKFPLDHLSTLLAWENYQYFNLAFGTPLAFRKEYFQKTEIRETFIRSHTMI
jgi:hypothetical protein